MGESSSSGGVLIDDGSLWLPFFVFTTGSATGGWRSIALIGRLGRDNSLLG